VTSLRLSNDCTYFSAASCETLSDVPPKRLTGCEARLEGTLTNSMILLIDGDVLEKLGTIVVVEPGHVHSAS